MFNLSGLDFVERQGGHAAKYGKTVREIEHFMDTVSHKIYKITGSEEEIVMKIPKKISEYENQKIGILDLIFET